MTDQQAILAAILAAPDDPVPRLVYTDWLEDNGRAGLAAVIRRRVHKKCNETLPAPAKRLEAPAGWATRYASDSGPPYSGYRCRWGQIEWVRCTLAEWLKHGPRLCDLHPVARLEITDKRPGYDGERYHWVRANAERDDYRLRYDVFRLLGPEEESGETWVSSYLTHDAATDAFSAACLRWARPWHRPTPHTEDAR